MGTVILGAPKVGEHTQLAGAELLYFMFADGEDRNQVERGEDARRNERRQEQAEGLLARRV